MQQAAFASDHVKSGKLRMQASMPTTKIRKSGTNCFSLESEKAQPRNNVTPARRKRRLSEPDRRFERASAPSRYIWSRTRTRCVLSSVLFGRVEVPLALE